MGRDQRALRGPAVLAVISVWGLAVLSRRAFWCCRPRLWPGLLFAGFGLLFAAISPYIDNLNLPTFLFINPMFLFSRHVFPVG